MSAQNFGSNNLYYHYEPNMPKRVRPPPLPSSAHHYSPYSKRLVRPHHSCQYREPRPLFHTGGRFLRPNGPYLTLVAGANGIPRKNSQHTHRRPESLVKFEALCIGYQCSGDCDFSITLKHQENSSSSFLLFEESVFGPLLVLLNERYRTFESGLPAIPKQIIKFFGSRIGETATPFWNSVSQRICQQEGELEHMLPNIQCNVQKNREQIRMQHWRSFLHFYRFLNSKDVREKQNCEKSLDQILNIEPQNLLALLHRSILKWSEQSAGGPEEVAAADTSAAIMLREWRDYNEFLPDFYARAVLHSELSFVYLKLGPEFQGAALAKYEVAADELKMHCQFAGRNSRESWRSCCELRVLHSFVCFGYALCAHRDVNLNNPGDEKLHINFDLQKTFKNLKLCVQEICSELRAVKPYDCRAFIQLAMCYSSFWKLCPRVKSESVEIRNPELLFLLSFEDLRNTGVPLSYEEFKQQFTCCYIECLKLKEQLCVSCYPKRYEQTEEKESNKWHERATRIGLCPHVLCPDVVSRFCAWNAVQNLQQWDEYSLSRLGKLVCTSRINLNQLDSRLSFQHLLDSYIFHGPPAVLHMNTQFTLQHLVQAERYLLWAHRIRQSGTSAHQLAYVYIDACKALHQKKTPAVPASASTGSSRQQLRAASPTALAAAFENAVAEEQPMDDTTGDAHSVSGEETASSTRSVFNLRKQLSVRGNNAQMCDDASQSDHSEQIFGNRSPNPGHMSQNIFVSETGEITELETDMTVEEVFSDELPNDLVAPLMCRTYAPHNSCEFLMHAKGYLETARLNFDDEISAILSAILLVDYKLLAPPFKYELESGERPKEAVLRLHRIAADKFQKDEATRRALEPLRNELAGTFSTLQSNPRALEFDCARHCERYGVMLALLGDRDAAIETLHEAVRHAIAAKALTRGAIKFGAKLLAWLIDVRECCPGAGQNECVQTYSQLVE